MCGRKGRSTCERFHMTPISRSRNFLTKSVAIGASAACICALGATAATAATGTPPSPDDSSTYSNAVPSWANPNNNQGATAADASVEGEIYFQLRDQKGAQALATSISTPESKDYGKSLSPSAWIHKFSPTQKSYTATVNYLMSQGLTITGKPDSRLFVVFRGTADQVNAAFSTQLHNYNFKGVSLAAPDKAPKLPAKASAEVAGISVDQGNLLTHPNYLSPDGGNSNTPQSAAKFKASRKASPNATPSTACSNWFGQNSDHVPAAYGKSTYPTYICGYTPSQVQSAYGRSTLMKNGNKADGSGQTVAIIDAYGSPTMLKDINTYSKSYGLPAMTSKTYKEIVPTTQFTDEDLCGGGPSGWQTEEALDVAAVHGTAPGAQILYVGGANCGGGLDVAMSQILDHKLANIVSNSYGDVGEGLPASSIYGEVNIQLQAAGEGIGLYFSSGDDGDESQKQPYTSPDFPASSPWVTAVGGTSLALAKSGAYVFETGWGSNRDQIINGAYSQPLPGTFRGGAGGGVSAVFAQPDFQKGIVPNSLAWGRRVSPDISSLADPYTGYVIGVSPITDNATMATDPYTVETYGGTSLAAPLTAGQMAVSQQVSGKVIGWANPLIYQADKSGSFTDVLPPKSTQALAFTSESSGNKYLVTLDRDTSLTTAKGYDDVTGVGSMSYRFATYLAKHGK